MYADWDGDTEDRTFKFSCCDLGALPMCDLDTVMQEMRLGDNELPQVNSMLKLNEYEGQALDAGSPGTVNIPVVDLEE